MNDNISTTATTTYFLHEERDDGHLRGQKLFAVGRLGLTISGGSSGILEAQLAQELHVELDAGLL